MDSRNGVADNEWFGLQSSGTRFTQKITTAWVRDFENMKLTVNQFIVYKVHVMANHFWSSSI